MKRGTGRNGRHLRRMALRTGPLGPVAPTGRGTNVINGISTRTQAAAKRTAEVDFAIESLDAPSLRADGGRVGVCVQDLMPAKTRRI